MASFEKPWTNISVYWTRRVQGQYTRDMRGNGWHTKAVPLVYNALSGGYDALCYFHSTTRY